MRRSSSECCKSRASSCYFGRDFTLLLPRSGNFARLEGGRVFREALSRCRGAIGKAWRPCSSAQSSPSSPPPLEPVVTRLSSTLVAPFCTASTFRHSATPSDSTVLQHQRANHHLSLTGSTMMIVDTLLEGVHSQCFMCSHRECRARSCHCAHLRPLQDLRYRLFGRGDSNSGHPARLASILPLYYVFASVLSANPYFSLYTFSTSFKLGI